MVKMTINETAIGADANKLNSVEAISTVDVEYSAVAIWAAAAIKAGGIDPISVRSIEDITIMATSLMFTKG